jgi:hypothetical protein
MFSVIVFIVYNKKTRRVPSDFIKPHVYMVEVPVPDRTSIVTPECDPDESG